LKGGRNRSREGNLLKTNGTSSLELTRKFIGWNSCNISHGNTGVLGSKLDQGTDYRDIIFLDFHSALREIPGQYFDQATAALFQITSNPSFIYPTTQGYRPIMGGGGGGSSAIWPRPLSWGGPKYIFI
jgi:hypothetical protein